MQRGKIFWFTGLSGSGKSTLAKAFQIKLRQQGKQVELLDGDDLRKTICAGLGFSREDRNTNVRRIAFIAELLARNGITVLISVLSPYKAIRNEVIQQLKALEIFVDAPLEVLIQRDTKGLYAKALAGEIQNFTGISDPYEAPEQPDLHLRTDILSITECLTELERLC